MIFNLTYSDLPLHVQLISSPSLHPQLLTRIMLDSMSITSRVSLNALAIIQAPTVMFLLAWMDCRKVSPHLSYLVQTPFPPNDYKIQALDSR